MPTIIFNSYTSSGVPYKTVHVTVLAISHYGDGIIAAMTVKRLAYKNQMTVQCSQTDADREGKGYLISLSVLPV